MLSVQAVSDYLSNQSQDSEWLVYVILLGFILLLTLKACLVHF